MGYPQTLLTLYISLPSQNFPIYPGLLPAIPARHNGLTTSLQNETTPNMMNWRKSNITNNSVRRFLVLALIIVVPLLAACTGSDAILVSNISEELICQCGCAEVLSNCECSMADEMTALIEQKQAQGQSKEQIIQSFVDQYGEQVLAAPANP